jgi:hypothetical protein
MNQPNIDSSKIESSPLEKGSQATVTVGGDPLLPDPRLAQELGWLGRCFGHGDTARTNIAGAILAVFTLLLIFSIGASIFHGSEDVRKAMGGLITPIFGVITGSIGYITGKKSN